MEVTGVTWLVAVGGLILIGLVGVLQFVASVPYWYSAIPLFIWDRDLGFRERTASYWITLGMFPVFGVVSGAYCFVRLLG